MCIIPRHLIHISFTTLSDSVFFLSVSKQYVVGVILTFCAFTNVVIGGYIAIKRKLMILWFMNSFF